MRVVIVESRSLRGRRTSAASFARHRRLGDVDCEGARVAAAAVPSRPKNVLSVVSSKVRAAMRGGGRVCNSIATRPPARSLVRRYPPARFVVIANLGVDGTFACPLTRPPSRPLVVAIIRPLDWSLQRE